MSELVPDVAHLDQSGAKSPARRTAAWNFRRQLWSVSSRGPGRRTSAASSQVTYKSAVDDHSSIDNTDIRYANQDDTDSGDLRFGIHVQQQPDGGGPLEQHARPGASRSSRATSRRGPAASALVNGGLAQDVAGVGVLRAARRTTCYFAATVYRSEHVGSLAAAGQAQSATVQHPGRRRRDWRVAWQHPSKNNYFEVGTLRHARRVHAGSDRWARPISYTDVAADFQYAPDASRASPPTSSAQQAGRAATCCRSEGTYIHETSALDATFAAGGRRVPEPVTTSTPSRPTPSTTSAIARSVRRPAGSASTGTADPLLVRPGRRHREAPTGDPGERRLHRQRLLVARDERRHLAPCTGNLRLQRLEAELRRRGPQRVEQQLGLPGGVVLLLSGALTPP